MGPSLELINNPKQIIIENILFSREPYRKKKKKRKESGLHFPDL